MNGEPNVLIVGAGPTGLVMAHELAGDGIACRVVDKSPHRAWSRGGIQDAFNLAWKLSHVINGAAGAQLLDSYEAERKPVDKAVIRQTDRATRLVSLHGTIGRFVRDHLMSLLSRLPGSEERIGEGLSGIAVNYRRSPIVEEHGSVMAGPTAGDRAPDAAVADANGRPLRLYDLFAEHRHTLLLLGGSEAPKIALPRDVAVHRIAAPSAADGSLLDRDGAVAAQYGSAPAAYLIRPDGYVGLHCAANAVAALLPRHFDRLSGAPG